MKVQLTPFVTYKISNGDKKVVLDLHVESRWNGLIKLVTRGGQSLIVTEPTIKFGNLFDALFDVPDAEKPEEVTIVSGSPNLMYELTKDSQ